MAKNFNSTFFGEKIFTDEERRRMVEESGWQGKREKIRRGEITPHNGPKPEEFDVIEEKSAKQEKSVKKIVLPKVKKIENLRTWHDRYPGYGNADSEEFKKAS